MVFFDPGDSLHRWLDSLLSGRLSLSNVYYQDHMPGFFGYGYEDGTVYIANGDEKTFVVDNMFSHIMLRYGMVAWLILTFMLVALYLKAYKEVYFGPQLFGITLFLIYGFSETLGCRIECNYFLISLSSLLMCRQISVMDDGLMDSGTGITFKKMMLSLIKWPGDRHAQH